ncbi:MAG: 26S proteasome non-ATPase regulatory subunit 8 [Marteilia pararefringens]
MITPLSQNLLKLQKLCKEWSDPKSVPSRDQEIKALMNECEEFIVSQDLLCSNPEDADKHLLLIAREILEIGAYISLRRGEVKDFDILYQKLKIFYFDYSFLLENSAYMYEIIALHLMDLITSNMVEQFLFEIESLPKEQLETNVYLQHSVKNYECFMEGRYHQILLLNTSHPSPNFEIFGLKMLDSIRNEILNSFSTCYRQVKFREAAKLLFYDDYSKFLEFLSKKGIPFSSNPDDYLSLPSQNFPKNLVDEDNNAKAGITGVKNLLNRLMPYPKCLSNEI